MLILLSTRLKEIRFFLLGPKTWFSRKSDQYIKGETKLWDIGGDRFDPLDGAEELEIASLSLDEPEMEAMIMLD